MIEVRGAEQFAALSKALKDAGRKDLQRELGKAVNRALKPVKDELRKSARDTLPSSGGLAGQVAASKLVTRKRTSAKAAGVRILGQSNLSLYHLNQGIVRHRRKGKSPEEWTVQRVQKGWWDEPTGKAAPEVREELVRAMDEVAKKIDRSV